MVGPFHRFLLLPGRGDWGRPEYDANIRALLQRRDGITLSDDVFGYLYDILQWILSRNPANPKAWPGSGLNRFGPTIVGEDGAEMFERVFGAWAGLFALGPAHIKLSGGWVPSREGNYRMEIIEVDQDRLVATLSGLAGYGRDASSGTSFIMHLGI